MKRIIFTILLKVFVVGFLSGCVLGDLSPSLNNMVSDLTSSLTPEEREEKEKSANEEAGYGYATNEERDNIISQINTLKAEYDEKLLGIINAEEKTLESSEYINILNKAKSSEVKKEYAYALYWYRQADKMALQIEKKEKLLQEYYDKREKIIRAVYRGYYKSKYDEIKLENEENIQKSKDATSKYKELKKLIESGKPGHADVNEFALHDEWKVLLINAEKFGTEYGGCSFVIGSLKKGELDYATKTATYFANFTFGQSENYLNVISVIRNGYVKARKADWKDMPRSDSWPLYSVAGFSNNEVFTNGVAIIRLNSNKGYSAFYNGLFYRLSLNIVDENGRQLVKPVSAQAKSANEKAPKAVFKGISPAIMDKIANGTAKVNLVGVYLQYGKETTPGSFKEKEIPLKNIQTEYRELTYRELF